MNSGAGSAGAIYVPTANPDIIEQRSICEDNIAHEIYQNEKIKSLTFKNKSLTSEVDRLIKLLSDNGIKI